jgi:hypothetical protein
VNTCFAFKINNMRQKVLSVAGLLLLLLQMAANPPRVSASVVMNYGADGNDYFQFTTPSGIRVKQIM